MFLRFSRLMPFLLGLTCILPTMDPRPAIAQSSDSTATANATTLHHIKNVFVIMMENHNWTGNGSLNIKGNPNAHYINEVWVPEGAHPSNYNNPPHIHPSLPNYLWLEAGTNFGILNDNHANGANTQTTSLHLVTLLKNAGISWRSYDAWSDR